MNFGKWKFQEWNFGKLNFKNWKFGKLGLREWNFEKLNLKNKILEDYFENRNFWKIGILENYF